MNSFMCITLPFRTKALVQKCAAVSNCAFNVDTNSGHAFGILLAAVGTLRPYGAPVPVN